MNKLFIKKINRPRQTIDPFVSFPIPEEDDNWLINLIYKIPGHIRITAGAVFAVLLIWLFGSLIFLL